MYKMCVCYIIKQGAYFLSLSVFLYSHYCVTYAWTNAFVLLSFSLVVVVVVVCNNRENTAADGLHAFASVHSFKRGGTHAHSVHNDRTKGTQKKKRERETLI